MVTEGVLLSAATAACERHVPNRMLKKRGVFRDIGSPARSRMKKVENFDMMSL
jgi:hypothetical protein